MGRLVETGQVIVADSKNSVAVQTLIPSDYIEWIREVDNKVCQCAEFLSLFVLNCASKHFLAET